MKKVLFMLFTATILFVGCKKEEDITPITGGDSQVTIKFSPYEMTPMKATHPISEYTTHLDVYIQDNTDPSTPLIRFHQNTTSTSNYGTITTNMNSGHNYTIYAVAHRGTDTATLTNNVIIFPDNEKVTHTFFYKNTFSPEYNTDINCIMKRIIGQIRFTIQDTVPSEVTKMYFVVDSSYTRWNLNDYPEHKVSAPKLFQNFTLNTNGGATFNVYVMSESDTTTMFVNLTAQALTSNDSIFDQHQLFDIPIRNGYQTECKGTFFRNFNMGATFVAPDWNTWDDFNY